MRGQPSSQGRVDGARATIRQAGEDQTYCSIVHPKVPHSDEPSSPERNALEPTDRWIAPKLRQTIRNQHAGIPSYPNHAMYFSRPIAN